MIIIHPSIIREAGAKVKVISRLQIGDTEEILWYEFPSFFKSFLVDENLDAFLVGILFLALETGNDINLKAPVSARLFYNLTHYLIPALCLANPKLKKIRIIAPQLNDLCLNKEEIAGTGLSCGVDSFATYYDHIDEQGAFKIRYFTFLNVGSHGDLGGQKARSVYKSRLKEVKEFAADVGLEVIDIDSNLSEILRMNFRQTNTLRSISAILHLQKLFRNYFYASAYRLDYFKLSPYTTSDSDILNVGMLSTESTNFYSSVSQLSRIEKTELISRYDAPAKFLNVCTDPKNSKGTINCTSCEKCLLTVLTLDLLGKLSSFKEVFDIQKYYFHRDSFIGKIIATRNENQIRREIFIRLREEKQLRFLHFYHYSRHEVKRIKKSFKKYLKT